MQLQPNYPVHYKIEVQSLAGHLFKITQLITKPMKKGQVLSLPAWIPGSYMIRDFAKNVVSLQAFDQQNSPLQSTKLDKQTWKVSPCDGTLKIEYSVYAFDLSVRSAYINDEYAFFNGTSVFLLAEQYENQAHSLEIHIPKNTHSNWQIATSMHKSDFYHANNYDELIDHPVIMGELDSKQFTVAGVEFNFVVVGGHHSDLDRITKDLKPICRHHLDLFGAPYPVEKYVFMTLLCHQGFGGLEHRSSTVLQYSRSELPTKHESETMTEGYRSFLALCSHEFFHTWNIKQIKPTEFVQLDLCEEVYTEQLWIYEGFTSYFDDITLVRTQLIEPESYLELIAITLTRLARNPGNTKQSVTESSFDAWTRFYKQDASAANNIVSYYAKGGIIALCLDLKIRLLSDHKITLFNVMQELWNQYGRLGKGTEIDVIQQILSSTFKLDLSAFIEQCIYSTQPLPVKELFGEFGIDLQINARKNDKDKGGKAPSGFSKVDFGGQFAMAPTGVKITQVLEGRAAYQAGLQVEDLLLSVNQWQIDMESIQTRLDDNLDAETVILHLLRDGKLKTFQLPVLIAPADTVFLETIDIKQRDKWLFKNIHHVC